MPAMPRFDKKGHSDCLQDNRKAREYSIQANSSPERYR